MFISKINQLIKLLLFCGIIFAQNNVDMNGKVNTVGGTVNTFYNEKSSGINFYFTPDADDTYDEIRVYVKESSTAMAVGNGSASTNSGDCDAYFSNSDKITLSGVTVGGAVAGGGSYERPSGYWQSGNTYTVYIPNANIDTKVDYNNSGTRIYVGLQFEGNTAKWVCSEGTNSGSGTQATSENARTYFILDRIDPTIASIKEHTTNDSYASNMYIKTFKVVYIVGSENITGGIVWDAVSGTDKADDDVISGNGGQTVNFTTPDPSLADGAAYNITFNFVDPAGNEANRTYNNVKYDTSAPTVSNLTSIDETYTASEVVPVTVNFSETMLVTGTPQLTLETGAEVTDQVVDYTSGTNSNALLFNYTVLNNHINLDLDAKSRTSLALNGGTITDLAKNDLDLSGDALPADGSGNQLDERQAVVVDGDVPASAVLTSVTATGGTVKAGKWNTTNTGVAIVVPLVTTDASLDEGKIDILATENAANNMLDVVTDLAITTAERQAGSKTIALSEAEMEGIANYADGKTINFTAKTYDKAGNNTTGPATYKNLVIDISDPYVEQVLGTSGTYRIGETVTLKLDFSEAITLAGGDPTLTLNTTETHWSFTGSADAVATETGVSDDDMTLTFDVAATHVSGDLNHKSTTSLTLPAGVTIVDANGNNASLTLPGLTANTNGPPVSKALAPIFNIIIDGKVPTAQTVTDVITSGGDSVAVGYLNAGNDEVAVKIPIGPATDGSLENGQVILLAEVGSTPEADDTITGLGAENISSADVTRGFDLITVTELLLDDIGGVTDGGIIYFSANTKDAASTAGVRNSTLNTESATTLIVDQAIPISAVIAANKLTTTGGVVVDEYWNASNTGISAEVTVPKLQNGDEDTSLDGGHAQLEKNINNAGWVRMGNPDQITQAERIAGKKILTNTAAHLEKAGLTEGHTIKFRAVAWDVAGNRVDGATYATTYTVDQVIPTVDEVTSDENEAKKLKVGATLDIKVTFTEVVNILGTPKLLLDTDNTPGSVLSEAPYNSATNSISPKFRLTVATNNYNRDLNYRATTSLELDGGSIRDAAGNNVTLTLPALDNAKALKQKKDYWVDGVLPTILTVGNVITTGDTIVAGHWNFKNSGLVVTVPLETTDASLEGGNIQLQGRAIGNGADGIWDDFGPNPTISSDNVNNAFAEITATKAQFTGLNQFTDGDVVSFRAVVTDVNENSSTFTASNRQLVVDLTYPSTSASYKPSKVKSSIDFGGADDALYGIYWNQTHSGVNITIPFTNDASLSGGYLQFQARSTTGGTWIPIGFRKAITPAQVAAAADLTYSFDTVTGIEARTQPNGKANEGNDDEQEFGLDKIDGFGNDKVLYFRVMVADAAGNSIFSDASTLTLYVEERSPTINEVTSSSQNKAYKAADEVNLQVVSTAVYTADPNMTVVGTPQLKLETGLIADAMVNYTSGSGSKTLLFEYTVATGHNSADLNYFDINSLTLNGGSILDPYGNSVVLTLPTLGNANALMQKKDIVIDTTPPSVTFTYDDPDSLVRFEDAQLVVTATFTDDIQFNTVPILTIDFPNNTAGDKSNVSMTATTTKIFTYNLPLVDDSDGQIAVSITAKDKALNDLPVDSTFADSIVTIDNTDPIAFSTGLMTMLGDTVSGSWFNKTTDSIRVVLPIDVTDESLLRGNIQIQMRVDGKMTSDTWANLLPKDSLQVLTASISKYRTKKEVLDILTPQKLAQGDSVFVRALINDQVGNSTIGAISSSFFILDTIPPAVPTGSKALITLTDRPDTTISNLSNEIIFLTSLRNGNNNDTLWTNDSLNFATQNWADPKLEAEVAKSGIQRYEYSLMESASKDSASGFSNFRSYKSQANLLDTVIIAYDSLRHNRWYYPKVRAVDVAGNISDPILFYKTFRHNARPIVDSVARVIAREDILWEEVLKINDKDVATLLSDKFTYALQSFIADTTTTPWELKLPKINAGSLTAAVSVAGKVSFTPAPIDTASYVHRVIVTDAWGLLDTVDIEMIVNAVNDPPVLDLSSYLRVKPAPDFLTFNEGDSSGFVNLTEFSSDEDNLKSSLRYSFKIESKIPPNLGYPLAKIGFISNFSKKYKNKLISDLVDEYPSSTIIQKKNSLLIYPGKIVEFNDPIMVDSTRSEDKASLLAYINYSSYKDVNYYTDTTLYVTLSAIDPDGLIGSDTLPFEIIPENDSPEWTEDWPILPFDVFENDSLSLDFSNYIKDIDDSTLTITIEPLTNVDNVKLRSLSMSGPVSNIYTFASKGRKEDSVIFNPDELWFEMDSKYGKPDFSGIQPSIAYVFNKDDSLNTSQIKFKITATDGEILTPIEREFIVSVKKVKRPKIHLYIVQNSAFTNNYEIFIIDEERKTKDIQLKVQSALVTLETSAPFTFSGHFNTFGKEFKVLEFEYWAKGNVGDIFVIQKGSEIRAKKYELWAGSSADGAFNVIGKRGSVDFDQSILLLDSSMFVPHFNDRASYLLGNEALTFNELVEVSMPGEDGGLALYRRSLGTGWVELPSYTENGRINAYSQKMGYFRLGPKTLEVPGQTSLQQNYPNPFNPTTTIVYDLGFIDGPYQRVSITVYDILGRNIKTLINNEQNIGRYSVTWNGKDQNDVEVSSGIYFVHLLTDMGRSKTKKIMLMR